MRYTATLDSILYFGRGILVDPWEELPGNGRVLKIARLMLTVYPAEGMVNASLNLGPLRCNTLVASVILRATVAILTISVRSLGRQVAALATR